MPLAGSLASLASLNTHAWPTSSFAARLPWLRDVPMTPARSDDADRPEPSLDAASLTARLGQDGVGEIRIDRLTPDAPHHLRQALESFLSSGLRALLIDLSGCPDDLAAHATPIAAIQRALTFTPAARELPLAILVDARTGEAGQTLAAGLQEAGRAVVIGTPGFTIDRSRLVPQILTSAETARRLVLRMGRAA